MVVLASVEVASIQFVPVQFAVEEYTVALAEGDMERTPEVGDMAIRKEGA